MGGALHGSERTVKWHEEPSSSVDGLALASSRGLVHVSCTVEIPFVIIRPQFAEWGLISTQRVERRMGRGVDVRTRITPLWRRRQLLLHPLHIRRSISAQGASRRKNGVSKRPWMTGTQADSKTTTVGIYDLSSRSIPELRSNWVKANGILLGSQVAVSQEMTRRFTVLEGSYVTVTNQRVTTT